MLAAMWKKLKELWEMWRAPYRPLPYPSYEEILAITDRPHTREEIRRLIIERPCPSDGGMGAPAEFCDV